MKIARYGEEYCTLAEDNIDEFVGNRKMHLIKLAFKDPTEKIIKDVLNLYPNTNRFFISDNIKFYNAFLKNTQKKYYIENNKTVALISFFRKNNKCIFNFENLLLSEREFIFSNLLEDVLNNCEAVIMSEKDLINKMPIMELWQGNVLIA